MAAPGREVTNSTPINRDLVLSRPVKLKLGTASRQQERQGGNLDHETELLQDWQFMVALFPEEDMAWKKHTEMMPKLKNLWRGRQSTTKTIHHTFDLKDGKIPVRQQPNRAGH